MSKWKTVRWEQVLQIKNGKNQKAVESSSGMYPIYGSGGIMGYANDYICPEKTIIIGRKGSINSPIYVEQKFWNVDTAFGLVANSNLDSKFLYFFCVQYDFRRHNKGVTIPSLTKRDLLQISMPLPPLDEQKRIARNLELAGEIVEGCKEQLAELDKLVQSVFYEMFGDPVTNEKGWITGKLGDLCKFESGKAHENVVDENGQYILVTSRFIASGGIKFRKTNTVLSPLYTGDIVMVLSDVPNGKALAKCFFIDEDNKYTLNQRICVFRNESFNKKFLFNLLNRHPHFLSFNDGDSQTNLRKNDVLSCQLMIPPHEMQLKFSKIVTAVEEQKAKAQQALAESEHLFNSLMQVYFE